MTKIKENTATAQTPVVAYSQFSELDIHLFSEGRHFRLWEKLGSHPTEVKGSKGVYFAVWAPNAESVSVIGDFNHWQGGEHKLNPRWDSSGIWEGFIPDLQQGTVYKYSITAKDGQIHEKGDPYARRWEVRPNTASIVWDTTHEWKDKRWMKSRAKKNSLDAPMSVYEVHFGSWKRNTEDGFRSLTYREMAQELVPYVKEMGFTHVEFLPLMEFPFDGSWGYQLVGYFAPTSRYGTPQDFMFLVEAFHKAGIGVILDWVPSHFPGDAHGLFRFDGTALYEHEDPRKGYHPDWKSYIFNYGRNEVRSFLISNALYWLEMYHIDGIRVDAVASMLYLDYSREDGEWIPNEHGGRENLEAISLMQDLNQAVYANFPDVQTIAEESTAWPNVSRPVDMNGLGFGMKWMMGWMHDTLNYFKEEPIHRKYHQNTLTFSTVYGFSENFMLPLSHDEVVHGKGALIDRMPGDEWQRFANLRSLYTYMFTHPGTKLLFMGGEFGQTREWNHEDSLHWDLLQYKPHQGVQQLLKDLNQLYRAEPALFQKQFSPDGFEWIDHSDHENSVVSYVRKGKSSRKDLMVVLNLTPVPRDNYKLGSNHKGNWELIFNSDRSEYFGSDYPVLAEVASIKEECHGRPYAVELTLPPLGVVVYRRKA